MCTIEIDEIMKALENAKHVIFNGKTKEPSRKRVMESKYTHLERTHQRLVHTHHSSSVFELSAVVGRGEDRD